MGLSIEQKKECLDRVEGFKNTGITIRQACKLGHISFSQYYAYRKLFEGQPVTSTSPGKPKRKQKVIQFTDIELMPTTQKIAVIVCQPTQLDTVMRELLR